VFYLLPGKIPCCRFVAISDHFFPFFSKEPSVTADFNATQLNLEYSDKEPLDILRLAFERFERPLISFSGAEDVVLIEMATRVSKDLQVFTLDTGRLHPETYRFIEKVRNHYRIDIEVLSPDSAALESLVRQKGLFSFYQDGHGECCSIRKIAPLRKRLAGADAWITGQRKDQSPGTRTALPVVQQDHDMAAPGRTLIKFNPLANWSSRQVWEYIQMFDVPFNALHQQGYTSIGCEPCTRAVLPNQHEREGRWWWEASSLKECGLHAANLDTSKP
jgi:phosphoadenosine phosphosulfate reductase